MNRRSFLKSVSFFSTSFAIGLTLNPFDFLKKSATAKVGAALPKKYSWCYCDKVAAKNMLNEMRNNFSGKHFDDRPELIVAINPEKTLKDIHPGAHFYNTKLKDLGIDNYIMQSYSVISYSDAMRLHKLKMLGKRIYAA